MSVNAQLSLIPGSLVEDLLHDTQGLVLDWEPPEGDILDIQGYWHGLHFMLTGSVAIKPGTTLAGSSIISRHRVPIEDPDFWVVTVDETSATADALENLDRSEIEKRYEDLRTGEVQVNMQTLYEIHHTRSHVLALLDALVVFYRRAAELEDGVLISIN